MIPIVTSEQMRRYDAAAPVDTSVLIDRAARAVARTAIDMLGGGYGRRAVVIAGPGNNGADGRVATTYLERDGVRCDVVAPGEVLPARDYDLVIDAAFGTGISRPYEPVPYPVTALVLAVDIVSGVHGDTGELVGHPRPVDVTVTFAAPKPGLLIGPGASLSGELRIADIGLGALDGAAEWVGPDDALGWMAPRPANAHKWNAAVRVVGGTGPMAGAAWLAARSAQRSGAGMVQVASPTNAAGAAPVEAVSHAVDPQAWGHDVVAGLDRIDAVVVGPGLGRDNTDATNMAIAADRPMVIDGDALLPETCDAISARSAPTVVTPHAAEFVRLGGDGDGADIIAATAALAETLDVVVLRKGPATVIAAPGEVPRVVTSGDASLATAGTGDVLAGMIGAALAQGIGAFDAASAAAWIHGATGRRLGPGLIASELADEIVTTMGTLGELAR